MRQDPCLEPQTLNEILATFIQQRQTPEANKLERAKHPRMHAVQRHALRLLPQLPLPARCRVISGRRFPHLPRRAFRHSALVYSVPDGRSNRTDPISQHEPNEDLPATPEEAVASTDVSGNDEALGTLPSEQLQQAKERQSNYGSAARRSARNKKPREVPPIELPPWFLRNSVRLKEELRAQTDSLHLHKELANKQHDSETTSSPARYNLHEDIWKEILSTIRAGLALPNPSFADGFPAAKAHVLLQCPKDGGIFFLDAIAEKAASALNADLVQLDAQDIAEIGGDYIGEGQNPSLYSIRSLSYDAQQIAGRQNAREIDEADGEEEEFEEEEDDDTSSARGSSSHFQTPTISKLHAIPIGTFSGSLEDFFKASKVLTGYASPNSTRPTGPPSKYPRSLGPSPEQWNDIKLSLLLEAIVDAGAEKRKVSKRGYELQGIDGKVTSESASNDENAPEVLRAPQPTIIMIRDYKEINATPQGGRILGRLLDIIGGRRKEGQSIVLVGTVSSADLIPNISKSGIRSLQSEYEESLSRTIVVTPTRTPTQNSVFAEDDSRRIREINMRHLRDMIRRRSQGDEHISSITHGDWRLDSSVEFASGLDDSVWPFDRVHRIAVNALGGRAEEGPLTPEDVGRALEVLVASDEVKFSWANEEKQISVRGGSLPKTSTAVPAPIESEERMKRLRKTCNAHEKKLLSGVVNPGSNALFLP
jgi:hypothetical protein